MLLPVLVLAVAPWAHAALLPVPHALEVNDRAFLYELFKNCRIVADPSADPRPARYLADGLKALGTTVGDVGPAITLTIEGGTATGTAAQSYRLSVTSSGVAIRAPAPAGLFYGAVTFLQLLHGTHNMQPVEVADAPDLPLRGITVDFRYAGMTEARIRLAIDRTAALKGNLLVWWLQDRFAWTSHPELAGPGALSATTWGGLVAYADARFVEMVPYVDAYGHGERYLERPEWAGASRGEHGFWGEDDLQYCASDPRTWILFDDLSREAAAVFTNTTYLHAGMDEVGAQDDHLCADCRAAVRAIAQASGEAAPYPKARNRFVARRLADVAAHAAALGRRVMCWDDSATDVGTLAFGPGGIEAVPDGVVPFLWNYDADPAAVRRALSRPEARRFRTVVATSSTSPDNIERAIAATAAFPQVVGAVATIWEGDVRGFAGRWPGFGLALAMGWNRGSGREARAAAGALGPAGWAPAADPASWTGDNDDSPDPAVSPASPRAVRFPCPFAGMKDWRLVWDVATRLDLGRTTAIPLKLRSDDPAAIESVVVYFRSRDGWYRMPELHPTAAWTTASLVPKSAQPEGKPSGWKAITGIRVSVLPAKPPRQATHLDLEFPAD
jgi:hypothetical protein